MEAGNLRCNELKLNERYKTESDCTFINSTLAAGQPLAFNSVDAGEAISGLSDASSQGKSLDVFVNGQLLISGSESERAAGSRDYAIASGTELKFAFSLETDDVVQLIKR